MRQITQLLKGTAILTTAGLITRFLGFFYKIFLAQALGAEGMGIYQLIFPVFSVCHALTASGMETAISRFTASSKKSEQSSWLFVGLVLSLAASCLVSILLWFQADFIAIHLLHEIRCTALLRILAAAIPLSAIHCCFSGSYLGRRETVIPAAAQLLEQLIRIGSVWLLCRITISRGGEVTPALAVFGLLTGEAGSALFMLTMVHSESFHFPGVSAFADHCKSLLGMSLPLTANHLTLTLLQSAEAVLIPLTLQQSGLTSAQALSLYGILTGMALSFLMFPNAVTSSISSMLLPVISEEQAKGNRKNISLTIAYTIQFGLIIGFLCMGIFLRYGDQLGVLFFHEALAGEFLKTLAWICPVLYLTGNLSSILHGLGKTALTFRNQLISITVRITCILLFTPTFGIQGVLWGLLSGQILLCLLGFAAVSPYLMSAPRLSDFVLKPLTALLLSLVGLELFHRICPVLQMLPEIPELVLCICLTAVGYFLLLLLMGALKITHLTGLHRFRTPPGP
jgi:stage V sporulation protein B